METVQTASMDPRATAGPRRGRAQRVGAEPLPERQPVPGPRRNAPGPVSAGLRDLGNSDVPCRDLPEHLQQIQSCRNATLEFKSNILCQIFQEINA